MRVGVFQSIVTGLTAHQRISRLASLLASNQLDLIVCPELFMSGYNVGDQLRKLAEPRNAEFSTQIRKLAKSTKTAIVYGYPEQDGEKTFNAALCINTQGEIIANHRKLLSPPGFESSFFDPGNQITIFNLGGIKCAILICYDAEFPESVRSAAQAGARLVIVPTALFDNWGVVAEKVIPSRAFENGVWIAYANHAGMEGDLRYFGGSCIVNPIGQDSARADSNEALISAKIDVDAVEKAQARLPYLKNVHQLRDLLIQ